MLFNYNSVEDILNILKTGLLSAVATFARLLSGFLVMKLVAVMAGPAGVAQLGQFMSLTALLVVFAGGGIAPGVVKYVAEFNQQSADLKVLLNGALSFTLIASIVMCTGVLLLNTEITIWLLGDIQYRPLIFTLAFAQIFVAVNNLIVAIVNGMMDVRRLATIHVLGAVIGINAPLILGYYFELYGVLLAFILSQAAIVFVGFVCFKKSSYYKSEYLIPRFDRTVYKRLSHYSLMTLTSALLAPAIQIVVRNILAERFSWEQVGYWQAVTKVSEAYLLFITMAISVYYLPKLSAVSEKNAFLNEIKMAYKILVPLVVVSAVVIFCFRDLLTALLFSERFSGALHLYAPQLIGDVVKIMSFILSFIMLAKAMTRTFLASEVIFGVTYVLWVLWLTSVYGLIGAMYAFVINYLFYFVFTVLVAGRYIKGMTREKS